MEVPPHPATAMARRLAKPPHPSPPEGAREPDAATRLLPLPLTGARGTHGKLHLPAHPQVVITGSVNSSELTLFDPVIHAWRHGARGWPGKRSTLFAGRHGPPGAPATFRCSMRYAVSPNRRGKQGGPPSPNSSPSPARPSWTKRRREGSRFSAPKARKDPRHGRQRLVSVPSSSTTAASARTRRASPPCRSVTRSASPPPVFPIRRPGSAMARICWRGA